MGKRCPNQLSQIDIKAFASPTSRQFDITLFTFESVYYALGIQIQPGSKAGKKF